MKMKPKVSIVISILNREKDIDSIIKSILDQEYDNYEVFLVDNGSSDKTIEIIQAMVDGHNCIKFIDASDVKGSPYSARNRGIRKSTGEYIAFIDGYPDKKWLSELVKKTVDDGLDILAGKINFPDVDLNDIYKLYDAIFSLDTEYTVNKFKMAPTGNLIIRKDIFDTLGLFKENIRSGGDILLTSCAVKNGYSIGYCRSAVSNYYTRDKQQLIAKQKRIAAGQVDIWYFNEKSISFEIIKNILKLIVPQNPISIYNRISKSDYEINFYKFIKLYFVRNYLDKIRLVSCLKNVLARKS